MVDTNVLVRALVRDDIPQANAAALLLREAKLIAVTLPCLCEFVWVLGKVYKFGMNDIYRSWKLCWVPQMSSSTGPAVEAGLDVLKAGGDFADGIIAFQGNWLGGETYVSFDQRAVSLLASRGQITRLLQS